MTQESGEIRPVVVSKEMVKKEQPESRTAKSRAANNSRIAGDTALAAVIEATPNGILVVDSTGLIKFVNTQLESLFGYDRTELLNQPVEILVPERYRQSHPSHRTDFFANPVARRLGVGRKLYGRRKSGTELPIEIGLSPLRMSGELYVLASIVDITERVRTERISRESEERLNTVLENLTEGLVISDMEAQLVHWNRAAVQMHGFSSLEECLVRLPEFEKIFELSTLDGVKLRYDQWPLPRLMAGHRLSDFEVRIRRLDRDWNRVFRYGGAIIKEPGAGPLAFVTVNDITGRTQVEEALRHSQAQFSSIVESAMDAIIAVDEEENVQIFNAAAEKMFGCAASEAIGKPLDAFIPPSLRETHRRHIANFGETNITTRTMNALGNVVGVNARGEEFPIEASISQVQIGGSKLFTAILRDITDRRRSEENLRNSNQQLEHALAELKAKTEELAGMTQQLWQASKLATMGELAASVAHELNNPLATVALRTELLMQQCSGQEGPRRSAEIVLNEVERMARLVENLLQFSRRSHRQISTVDIRDEIEKSIELIEYHLRTHQIKISCDFAEAASTIHADRQHLRQLFLNLVTNATDAMPNGGVLSVRAREATLSGARAVLVEFADTGEGVSPENMEKLWEPFFTTKPEGKGTGLGLAICRRIVEEHGGTIDIESEFGSGTAVRIVFPAMIQERQDS